MSGKDEVVEPAELNKYMDAECASKDEVLDKNYLLTRYEQIKSQYDVLHRERDEAEKTANQELKNRVSELFTQNYKARKYIVRELRRMGEKIEDKFVVA